MTSQSQGNGRNVAIPDENRPSWRPQDEQSSRSRRATSDEDERYRDDDRYGRDRARYWEDREDREEPWRASERRSARPEGRYGEGRYGEGRYGEGRYGEGRYGEGRYGEGRYASRGPSYPGRFEERAGERGGERRWGEDAGYDPERYGAQGGYSGGRGWEAERIGPPRGYGYGSPPGYGYGEGERSPGYASGYAGSREIMGYSRAPMSARRAYESGAHARPYEPGAPGVAGGYRGRGPAGYRRSDERIRELVCDVLTEDDRVDATHIDVRVENGEITLAGTVDDRQQKRCAEDAIENISGVRDVHNHLRVGGEPHHAAGSFEGDKRRS